MRVLLDTHYVLWLTMGGAQLTPPERQLLADNAASLFVSAVSIWELRLKWHSFHVSGARKGGVDPSVVLAAMLGLGLNILPLTATHAMTALAVPVAHNDPFDELLLVQAQAEDLRLLTRDRVMPGHPLVIDRTET